MNDISKVRGLCWDYPPDNNRFKLKQILKLLNGDDNVKKKGLRVLFAENQCVEQTIGIVVDCSAEERVSKSFRSYFLNQNTTNTELMKNSKQTHSVAHKSES